MSITDPTTRRGILAALPSLAAAVVPGATIAIEIPAQTDPIFAAIEAAKAAHQISKAAHAEERKFMGDIASNGLCRGLIENDKFVAGHFNGWPLYATTEDELNDVLSKRYLTLLSERGVSVAEGTDRTTDRPETH